MKFLALDPSVKNVGWSVFDLEQIPKSRTNFAVNANHIKKRVWSWGTWYLEGSSLEMRMFDLCATIAAEIGEFDILITEKPAFYSSEKGQIAAHQNYTIDLSAVNNFVAGWFHRDHRHYFPITAITWKGSVPKWITERQFFRVFGYKATRPPAGLTEHSVDATMLLHYWLKTYGRHSTLLAPYISPELLKLLL